MNRTILSLAFIAAVLLAHAKPVLSAPTGANWFWLSASPNTATVSTDGFPYYYVGQTFYSPIAISSDQASAANIWIDFSEHVVSSGIYTGSYFPYWSGQTVEGSRFKSSGYIVGGSVSGSGDFGSASWKVVKPTASSYGIGTYGNLGINVGTIGKTTESNISYQGLDKLESAQGLSFRAWADTKKPYAKNPVPADGSAEIPVESLYTFELRDSLAGEGNDFGVGTGVDLSQPPGTITANSKAMGSYAAFSCSGIWGTNLCIAKLDSPSPLSIAGDKRNWEYGTKYIIDIFGFRDLASPEQGQLGDTAGPNIMAPKIWSFTTEADTVVPRVMAQNPARDSSSAVATTPITIDVLDLKTYPGQISGTGVDASTCSLAIWSDSMSTSTYAKGVSGLSDIAIDYGVRFTVSPSQPFLQDEWVYVSISKCKDLAGNTMTDDAWRFKTADLEAPFVDGLDPSGTSGLDQNGSISFHIKDTGVGVDISKLVVYVNGVYYKNTAQGAGLVTLQNTRITYPVALAFSSLSGTADDYVITITPETAFTPGQGVTVLVYAQDFSGNLMERVAYALAVGGGICHDGQDFCGPGTAWDGVSCISVCQNSEVATDVVPSVSASASSTPSSSSSETAVPQEGIFDVAITQVDARTVLVTWRTGAPATSRVIFGRRQVASLAEAPNYGYDRSSAQYTEPKNYHGLQLGILLPDETYYFRPVSNIFGTESVGPEISFTIPKDAVNYLDQDLILVCPSMSSASGIPSSN